ncbi:MAG: hypothetical protein HXX11_20845 [Desulfuromonadales bacterium]|nr:hypothetical protein [Desulfuromonadales bacterium]
MPTMKGLVESHYQETFDTVYADATALVEKDRVQGMAQIRGLLRSMYTRQGNDIDGRGHFGDSDLAATIAAYELVLSDMKKHAPEKVDETTKVQ